MRRRTSVIFPYIVGKPLHLESRIARPHRVGQSLGARETLPDRLGSTQFGELHLQCAANRLRLGSRLREFAHFLGKRADLGIADEQGHTDIPSRYLYITL
jgi:hypothetical protein